MRTTDCLCLGAGTMGLEESCPNRVPMQPPLAGFSRLAFAPIPKTCVFVGKKACLRPIGPSPMRGSAARHKTLCAIDQAHCEVQKAQSRVTRPAAGDLRHADHGACAAEKSPLRGGLRRAECLTQRASSESLGGMRPGEEKIAIGLRLFAAFVAAFGTIRGNARRAPAI